MFDLRLGTAVSKVRASMTVTYDIDSWLVYLIDCNNETNLGVLDQLEHFACLRHNAVICSDYEDDDIGDAGSSGSHSGEGSMSRSVKEGDRACWLRCVVAASRHRDGESTNMLCDPAGFPFRYGGRPQGV